jgi:hypothetical protein
LASTVEKFWIPATAGRAPFPPWGQPLRAAQNLPVLLYPYNTPACRFQHHQLAAELRALGQQAEVLLDPLPTRAKTGLAKSPQDFPTFATLAQGVLAACGSDEVLARGALDEFLRKCPVESFFNRFVLTAEFLDSVSGAKRAASSLITNYSGLVVADGAYLKNRALISAALKAGKPVQVFNPDGNWRPVTRHVNEITPRFDIRELINAVTDGSPRLAAAEKYLAARFAGTADDFDSQAAFANSTPATKELPRKKVLFLHCVRDANQVPLEHPAVGHSAFTSFFEWADFSLAEIAKSPDQWKVKLHPSAKFYAGEEEIQSGLLRKHAIPIELTEECPPTSFLLANRWPVYTHSGTIILEAAASGYRGNACSTTYPQEFAQIAQTREDWRDQMAKPAETAGELIEDSRVVDAAKVWLCENTDPDEPLLMPRRPQPDRTSEATFFSSQILQELSLMARYLRSKSQKRLREVALEFQKAINVSQLG